MDAKPKKLRDGSWGAVAEGVAEVGDTLTLITKSGKSWNTKVTKVIWSGDNKFGPGKITIVETSGGKKKQTRKVDEGEVCSECGRSGATELCIDSSGIPGVCCERCASLSPVERSFA